jgi:hypothetical protein
MGFSGGGSNVLLPHTHDGTVSQDGGPLDFNNITQASLNAGDVIFSDGVHLQRLAIGGAADVLEVNPGQTAPQWTTPSGGGATLTRSYATYATAQSTSSATLVSLTNMTTTLQAGAGNAVCQYNSLLQTDESYAYAWDFSVDGTQPEISGKATNTTFPVSMEAITATLGGQDVTMQYRVKNPAGTAIAGIDNTNSTFYVLEIS